MWCGPPIMQRLMPKAGDVSPAHFDVQRLGHPIISVRTQFSVLYVIWDGEEVLKKTTEAFAVRFSSPPSSFVPIPCYAPGGITFFYIHRHHFD